MKKYLVLAFVFCAALAQGETPSKWYIECHGGIGSVVKKSRFMVYGGGAVGYRCYAMLPLRAEAEITADHVFRCKKRERSFRYMVNGYVEFPNQPLFIPYLGAGIGVDDRYKRYCSGNTRGSTQFAGQGIIGLGYPLCYGYELGIEYRYIYRTEHSGKHLFGLALRHSL